MFMEPKKPEPVLSICILYNWDSSYDGCKKLVHTIYNVKAGNESEWVANIE